MLRALFARKAAEPSKEVLNAYNNPYRAKRLWPPDLSKLSHKHQFRLERKFKRRSVLKYQRPGWMKGTKLAQWGTVISVLVYGVLYMDWEKEMKPSNKEQPFQGIRNWWHSTLDSIWTGRSKVPSRSQQQASEIDRPTPKAG